jgi:hypothetical protein
LAGKSKSPQARASSGSFEAAAVGRARWIRGERTGHPAGRDRAICSEEVVVAATQLSVNGSTVSVTVDDADTPLLYVLRNELGLRGPRFDCGLGQCGACTVHFDGNAVRSCITPLSSVAGRKVMTLELLPSVQHHASSASPIWCWA